MFSTVTSSPASEIADTRLGDASSRDWEHKWVVSSRNPARRGQSRPSLKFVNFAERSFASKLFVNHLSLIRDTPDAMVVERANVVAEYTNVLKHANSFGHLLAWHGNTPTSVEWSSAEGASGSSALVNTPALEQMLSEKLGDDPEFEARVRKRLEQSALIHRLALEQNAVSFDPVAGAILGRIFDRGHATCEDLADWLESPEEWIAFSRLQRARLLYDSGTEFTVSPDGRRLIYRILNDISVIEGSAE